MGAAIRRSDDRQSAISASEATNGKLLFKNACCLGDVDRARNLLLKVASLEALRDLINHIDDEDGDTPLTQACRLGRADVVELLVSAGSLWRRGNNKTKMGKQSVQVLDANKSGSSGWPPLLLACQLNHEAIAKILLIACPDIDVNRGSTKSSKDGTPLLWCRTQSMREMLVARGAVLSEEVLAEQFQEDWSKREEEEKEKEMCAQEARDKELAARIPPEGVRKSIIDACKIGNSLRLRELVAEWGGHNVLDYSDEFDCAGFTPLLWAAANGHYECVKILIEPSSGVDVCRANNAGNTPLLLACAYGHLRVVILLCSCREAVRGSVNRPNLEGKTPYKIAGKDKEIRGVLVEYGAIPL